MAPGTFLNPRTHHFTINALYLGVTQLAEVDLHFMGPGEPHAHVGQTQVIFELEGQMDLFIGQERWRLPPGGRCVVRADEWHRAAPVEAGARVRFLDLRVGTGLKSALGDYLASLPEGVCPGPVDAVNAGSERLAALVADGRRPPTASLAAEVWRLLALYESLPEPAAPDPPPEDARLRLADRLMREHLQHPMSVEALARSVGLSPSRLRQLSVDHYGASPLERYRQIRFEQARQLVESSTLAVKQIAHACGFRNPNHFSRVFTDWAGRTPTEVRREAQARSRRP